MRAVLYCRISRDPHGNELGVRRQEQDGRALCKREEYELVETFVDDDRSAYSGKPRPRYEAMRQLVGGGGIDVVVAWHPDRLTRHPRELEDLIDLLESSATTVRTVQTGEYDLGTPSGRMVARVIGAMARHESEHKSARLRRKHLELAQNGQNSGGGRRPFGFDADRVTVRDTEAAVIRDMAAWTLEGEPLKEVCRRLAARDVVTVTGAPWAPITVKRLLMSARIAGMREHRGLETDAVWPAIISADDHQRLRVILSDPGRASGRGGREMKLLTGLVVCGLCGERLMSRPRPDRRPTYRCCSGIGFKGCGKILVSREPLEDYVIEAALHALDTATMSDALAPPADDEATLAELRGVEARSEELAAMWAAGEVTRQEWAAASVALNRRRSDLEADLRGYVTERARGGDAIRTIVDHWDDASATQRRLVLHALIESIVVNSARRGANQFEHDRVAINWRA